MVDNWAASPVRHGNATFGAEHPSENAPLPPMNFRRKRWVLCRAMNWRDWPDDILRHSYGSYHLAKHRNAALTAGQMGHKNARMLYAHYREIVKDSDHVNAASDLLQDSRRTRTNLLQ